MTKLLNTATGSTYELDVPHRRIRRLTGTHEPTARQGIDGEWKTYTDASVPSIGRPLMIIWRTVEGTDECTITSPVTSIESDS